MEKLTANAKYTSPDIQNEVIRVVVSLLSSKIANRVKKAQSYTVMMDGSTDRNWREEEEIVV